MIRSILDLQREEVENLSKIGFTRATPFHFDVCKALASGLKQEEIAEKFNIDDSAVRKIKSKKCPGCGLSVNQNR